MIEKTLIKQNEKDRINHTVAKQLNKNKEANSCNSCGVCNRLRSPHSSFEGTSSALSYAKAIGKESCAVSFMQRNYGNRFTASVLNPAIQKKCSCGGSCSNCKGEEEAEKISMSIMKMESRQQSVVGGRRTVDSGEHAQISEIMSNKGSGHGLDDSTSSFMKERFGYDFSHVRLHTDSYAARKSNELNAEAFTIGRDVFFNAGRYNPSSMDGKSLLAHELTHVVQQKSAHSLIQFQRFRDCTPSITGTTGRLTQADIDTLINSARLVGGTMALHAVNAMRGIRAGTGSATAMAALANHFGAPTPAQINTIFSRFENIQRRLTDESLFICNTAGSFYCKRAWCAYTRVLSQGYTHLCPGWFEDPYTCLGLNRSRNMVHEAAHAAGAPNDTYPGAGYPPANAHDNAPSYAGFANEVMARPTLGPPSPERPKFPSLIDDIIRHSERRMRERVIESVKEM